MTTDTLLKTPFHKHMIDDKEVEELLGKNPLTATGEYQKMTIRLLHQVCKSLDVKTEPVKLDKKEKPQAGTKRKRTKKRIRE